MSPIAPILLTAAWTLPAAKSPVAVEWHPSWAQIFLRVSRSENGDAGSLNCLML
jgi:hypothetical protein